MRSIFTYLGDVKFRLSPVGGASKKPMARFDINAAEIGPTYVLSSIDRVEARGVQRREPVEPMHLFVLHANWSQLRYTGQEQVA